MYITRNQYQKILLQTLVAASAFCIFSTVLADDVYRSGRIVNPGTGGSNPFGNIHVDSGSQPGPTVGSYTTQVTGSDGSYTLHIISTDAASNVTKHQKKKYDANGQVTTTYVPTSEGKKLGDVIGGGLETGIGGSGSGGPMCLSVHCDQDPLGDPFGDPYNDPYSVQNSYTSGG